MIIKSKLLCDRPVLKLLAQRYIEVMALIRIDFEIFFY